MEVRRGDDDEAICAPASGERKSRLPRRAPTQHQRLALLAMTGFRFFNNPLRVNDALPFWQVLIRQSVES